LIEIELTTAAQAQRGEFTFVQSLKACKLSDSLVPVSMPLSIGVVNQGFTPGGTN